MATIFLTPSAVLAQRANDAKNGQKYVEPDKVSLPGALRALTVDELDAHHAVGRAVHEIVGKVNDDWRELNKTRLAQSRHWVSNVYEPGIQRRREAAARANAERQEKSAALERLIAEDIAKQKDA